MKPLLKQISDAEIEQLVSMLDRYPIGLPLKDIARRMGIDARRVRAIASYCRMRTVAPVISTYSNIENADVYKIADDPREIDIYLASERRRLAHLETSINGLEYMKKYGRGQRQGAISFGGSK